MRFCVLDNVWIVTIYKLPLQQKTKIAFLNISYIPLQNPRPCSDFFMRNMYHHNFTIDVMVKLWLF